MSSAEDLKKKMMDPKHHSSNPTMLFTIGVCLGALSCFSRADYNLPLFAFLAIMWDSDDVSSTISHPIYSYFLITERKRQNKIPFNFNNSS